MNAVVERQATEVVQTPHPGTATTPSTLLAMAVAQGADLDRLERLMALQERWEAGEARKAFTQAMTDFKAEPLEIFKRKQVGYTTKEGEFVGYKHAQLCDVVDVVVPAMAKHGLSHRWDVKQDNGRILVTCTVTHRAGHSESVTLDGAPDNSGKKNAIQQVASTIQYLERYSLLAITGLSTKDERHGDDDGQGGQDTSLRDDWIERANAALNPKVLAETWALGVAEIREAGSMDDYHAFKAAVEAKGQELRGAKP